MLPNLISYKHFRFFFVPITEKWLCGNISEGAFLLIEVTLISLINMEVGINLEGLQKLPNH
jgi:hypothetical protein